MFLKRGEKMKTIIIGAGRIGTAIAYLLQVKGVKIIGVHNQHLNSAEKAIKKIGAGIPLTKKQLTVFAKEADLIIITTPDNQISKMAQYLAKLNLKDSVCFMHMSGLLLSDVLKTDQKSSGVVSFHPLQSVASFQAGIKLLPKAVFTIEGDKKGEKLSRKIVNLLGIKAIYIEKKYKPLYHAAAVMASNYLVTLIYSSYQLLEESKLNSTEIKTGIIELVKGTLNNIERLGPEQALTGPIAREDSNTIKSHQKALLEFLPEYYQLYQTLGEYTVKMAKKEELTTLFTSFKSQSEEE